MRINPEITSKFYATLANTLDLPVINLQVFHKIQSNVYSAVFSTARISKKFTFDEYNRAVSQFTNDAFKIVEGSLYEVDSNTAQPLYRAILVASLPSIAYDDNEAIEKRQLTCLHANVFQDGDENMWRAVGEGKARRLVQMSQENFDEMLAARKERNPVIAAFTANLEHDDGDYISFYNPDKGSIDFGFLMHSSDGEYVLSRDTPEKPIKLEPMQILEAACLPVIDLSLGSGSKKETKTLASPRTWKQQQKIMGAFSTSAYLDYMRSLFGNTAYFKALEKAIKNSGVK